MTEPDHKKKARPLLISLFDELRGERVVVRLYREEDAPGLQEAVEESREHIRPWLPFADDHKTIEESCEWILEQRARWTLREIMNYAIVEVETGRYLGGISLTPHDWNIPYFEIGYWLRASAEGKGYITEAVRLLTGYALNELSAKRVEIQCDERNERSASVARKLGYVQEGRMRNDFTAPDGSVRNTLMFSMTPEDSGIVKRDA